jgi:hypothetical protein
MFAENVRRFLCQFPFRSGWLADVRRWSNSRFGFSFALRDMLELDGPHLAISLAAFNVGVEIGQIIFATLVWAAMAWLSSHAGRWQPRVKAIIALCCIGVAAIWIFERAKPIASMVL